MENVTINNLYVVKDKVANDYGPSFEAKTDGVAMRQYEEMLEKQPNIDKEDFQLICIGTVIRTEKKCTVDGFVTPKKLN